MKRWGTAAVLGNQALDYGLLGRMEYAQDVYNTVHTVRNAVGEQITKIPPATWEFFEWLVSEGYTT